MNLALRVLPGRFAVCRVAGGLATTWPASLAAASALWSITKTDDEVSLVCDWAAAPTEARVEGPFAALRVEGTLDFALVGILSRLCGALAEAGVSVFALSTFDTDYLLVREAQRSSAIEALRGTGCSVAIPARQ